MAKMVDPVALYEKLVATLPGVERKGDTVPYTSVNGHMFSNLTRDGKLALAAGGCREAFLARYKTRLVIEYGVVRKEYVEVPDALLARTGQLEPYFAQSFAYVSALKPKRTSKAKAKVTQKAAGKIKRQPRPAGKGRPHRADALPAARGVRR